jgi:hypothetical protein
VANSSEWLERINKSRCIRILLIHDLPVYLSALHEIPDMNSLDTLLVKTIEITKKAADLIETERKNFDFSKIEYKGKNDLVSFVDKQSEIFLVESLGKILPEAGFIAEEGTGEAKKSIG